VAVVAGMRLISLPNGVWTRSGYSPKNLLLFVVASVAHAARNSAVGFVFWLQLVVF
jgi:hypothetical protein